jgi:hypothetical protein
MTRNVDMIEILADGLADLLGEVVFVGGATVALYATDPASPEPRPTDDVDVVVEIRSRLEYNRFEDILRSHGFVNDMSEGAPLCRWVYRGIKVDAMPTDPEILGFANRWYDRALENSMPFVLPGGRAIRILTPSYFLASKLEAFQSRGRGDIRLSADLEDVLYVLDNRPAIVDELIASDTNVKQYIGIVARAILEDASLPEAIEAALGFGTERSRAQRVLSIVSALANLS